MTMEETEEPVPRYRLLPYAMDSHLHLREADVKRSNIDICKVMCYQVAQSCRRGIIMPNTSPPICNTDDALRYRQQILTCCARLGVKGVSFEPLMTIFLSETTTVKEVRDAAECPYIIGAKLYPAGVTTNSEQGPKRIKQLYPLLAAMQKYGLTLLVHGEQCDPDLDDFDRERVFLSETLEPLVVSFPRLKLVLEHISTQEAVKFVLQASEQVAATITPQHLLLTRNDLFRSGSSETPALNPHHYCLPLLKTKQDTLALVEAVMSGSPRFFMGSDCAPHLKADKECASGKAGCFSYGPSPLPLYMEAFARWNETFFTDDVLWSNFENFCCHNANRFHGLSEPPVEPSVKLLVSNHPSVLDSSVPVGDTDELIPIWAGKTVRHTVWGPYRE
jgi:dihydroorotase